MKPSPTSPITLKGTDFDNHLKQSFDLLEGVHRIQIEGAKPTVWTASQIYFLGELYNAFGHVQQALTILADRARDD